MFPFQAENDLDLEFYELRDEAAKRVAIKRSVQIHFAVWSIVNFFLVLLNMSLVNFQPKTLAEFWVFWTLSCWGYGLYVHATVWFTINVQTIGKRIFYIHVWVAIGLVLLLAVLNILLTPGYYWFWWVLGGEIAFLIIHFYIIFISSGINLENAIQKEIQDLRSRSTSKNPESNPD